MYNYTPNPNVLRKIFPKRIPGKQWWDIEFYARFATLKEFGMEQDYSLSLILNCYYKHTNYFSKERLKYVPIHGRLFPVEMFTEQKV